MVRDHEKLHERLFRAHALLTNGGQELHAVIVALHDASRHSDTRSKLAAILADLEKAREAADDAWKIAGRARTELIRQTGCDGKCSDRARGIKDADTEDAAA